MQGTGTTVNTVNTNYLLDNLEAFKEYSVYIKTVCASNESNWVGPTTFTTQCSTDNGVYNGDVTLATQQEVDDFGAQCYTSITGHLRIGAISYSGSDGSDITSLLALQAINSINSLTINNNILLETLEGLENITSLDNLSLLYNPILNLTGLENLSVINNDLFYSVKGIKYSFEGLNNLTTIHGAFEINETLDYQYGIPFAYRSFQGLDGLTSIGVFKMFYNEEFQSFEGLENLETVERISFFTSNFTSFINLDSLNDVGSIYVGDEDSLTSFTGLENITHLNRLHIRTCHNLISLEGLNALSTVEGNIFIERNSSLSSLEGLEELTSVGSIEIGGAIYEGNNSLTNFCSLQNLFTNGTYGNVAIANNAYNPTVQDIIDGNCAQ